MILNKKRHKALLLLPIKNKKSNNTALMAGNVGNKSEKLKMNHQAYDDDDMMT